MKKKILDTIKYIQKFLLKAIKDLGKIYDKLWILAKNFKWKKLLKVAEGVSIGVIVVLCTLTVLEFSKLNFPIKVFIVQSGSMEPKIGTGSLIFSFERENYEIGDIISFDRSGSTVVTHRIVGKSETGEFITKGDANEDEDINTVQQSNIVGRVIFTIPLVGYLINFAKTFQGLTMLIIVPGTIIIYEEIKLLIKDIKLNFAK